MRFEAEWVRLLGLAAFVSALGKSEIAMLGGSSW